MGRFDLLTSLEAAPQSPSPTRDATAHPETPEERKPETLKTGKPETLKEGIPDIQKPRFPESGIAGNPGKLKSRNPETVPFKKAEKYSTQLDPGVIKQIKQYAIEHDVKDYEVVQLAIKDFLAKNK